MKMILIEDSRQQSSYTVYIHTTPSGKKYIGITSQKPEQRWRNGSGYIHNPAFINAIKKYGWENIEHQIICSNLTKVEAENLEIQLIKEHKTTDSRFGYNIENGGNCTGTHSEETKRKIGNAKRGNKDCCGRKLSANHIEKLRKSNFGNKYMYGKKLSEEAKRKISIANKGKIVSEETKKKLSKNHPDMSGENNPMYGKHHSNDTRRKISEKAIGRVASIETRMKMSEKSRKRAVIQIDLDGNQVKVFDSCKDAAISVSGNTTNICFACRNPNRTYKGYKWRYAI